MANPADKNKPSLVVSVTSGKGGVGKSIIVVNLAGLLAQAGRRVLVMDCDLGLANVDVLLGLNPNHSMYNVVEGRKKIEEIVMDTGLGFDVLPAASGIAALADISAEEQGELMAALRTLLGRYDVVLLDTGAGISAPVIRFNQAAHQNIIVLTPEPTSVTDAYALIKLLRRQEPERCLYLLVNMVRDEEEALRVADNLCRTVERFLKCSLLNIGYVVADLAVRRSVLDRTPLIKGSPDAPAAVCLKDIARRVSAWKPEAGVDKLDRLIHG